MVIAAAICALLALGVLVNIEAWRRRTVAELNLSSRRQTARERAWAAVDRLDLETTRP
jgi:hypothetical protein